MLTVREKRVLCLLILDRVFLVIALIRALAVVYEIRVAVLAALYFADYFFGRNRCGAHGSWQFSGAFPLGTLYPSRSIRARISRKIRPNLRQVAIVPGGNAGDF